MGIVLWLIAAYILYKLLFGFIIPVYKTSKAMREKFRDIQSEMNGRRQNTNGNHNTTARPSGKSAPASEYIEFEEIR